MPRRKSRPFVRKSNYRDAKAIVIATEGSLTEPIYFESLAADERFRNPRVTVTVLPTREGLSAPSHVIRRLDVIRRRHVFVDGDELWLVIDKDGWEDGMLSEVARLANQKGYCIADSNPCFEVWLALHFCSIQGILGPDRRKALMRCINIVDRLKKVDMDPLYRKSSIGAKKYFDKITKAIQHAKLADIQPDDRYLNQIGSRVYRLVESIIESS